MFTIENTGGARNLKFLGNGPWTCFSSVRLLLGGTEIDNIDQYGRWHEWSYLTLPWNDQWAEQAVCGWGGSLDAATGLLREGQPIAGEVQPGEKITVLMKLNLSLFNSAKLLPVRFMPLELHLTLANSADWLNMDTGTYSTSFALTGFQCVYDQCVLDEGISNSLYQSLLNSRILSLPIVRAHMFSRSIAGGATTVDLSVQRAYSKVSAIIVTFSGDDEQNVDFRCPSASATTNGAMPGLDDGAPWCPSIRVSLGGKNFPDPQPLDNIALYYHQLVKALGYSPNLSRDDFTGDSFCAFFDFKRVPFDHGSAISTRSGDLIRIEIKNMTANRVTKAHVVVLSYGSLAVRESGVAILD
jgi:hypothetical protein